MQSRRYTVTGRVQGVGYRYFAHGCARQRGLTGYVHNLWNGDVEVVGQGTAEALDLFEADLRRGPRASRVTGVTVEDVDIPPCRDFGVDFF